MSIRRPDLLRVLAVSSILRAPVVVVAPLVPVILLDSTITAGVIGFAAGATLLWFALGAFLVPSVFARWTPHRLVLLGLAVACGGILLRSLGTGWAFLAGAAVLGVGIGALNIAVPGFIDELVSLPRLVGSLVAIGLNIGAIAAAALVVYVDRIVDDWRVALCLPIIFVLLALVGAGRHPTKTVRKHVPTAVPVRDLRGRRTLVLLTVLMFVQSSAYYVFLTWFPYAIVRDGVSLELAGIVVALNQAGQLVAGLMLSYVVRRSRRLEWLEALFLAGVVVGGALVFSDSAAVLVVGSIILGVGNGSGLAVVLSQIMVKSPSVETAQAASALIQGLAYAGTALMPVLFGLLSEVPALRSILCLFMVTAGVAMVLLWVMLRGSGQLGARAGAGDEPEAATALG